MTIEISFYEVRRELFEKTTCKIIEKCYQSGKKTLVKTENESQQEVINSELWTFARKSFVPHGSIKDEVVESQPVLITHNNENIISAEYLVLVGSDFDDIDQFERVFVIYNSSILNHKLLVDNISDRINNFTQEKKVNFFTQGEDGGWTNKSH
ncbi:MAG: DNA polymerase III subunit chi [Rickettsiaceae bacterium]|nr:DNA polymerase III subunit chi [Rickettsiaceae bacterium]